MFRAQCTWDATMAHNSVRALERHGGPEAIMVVLIGVGARGLRAGHPAPGGAVVRRDGWPSVHPDPGRRRGRAARREGAGLLRRFRLGSAAGDAMTCTPALGLSTTGGRGAERRTVIHVAQDSVAREGRLQARATCC